MIAACNSCLHSWCSGSDYALSCYPDTVREQWHWTPSPSNRCKQTIELVYTNSMKQTEGCGWLLSVAALSHGQFPTCWNSTLLSSSHHFAGYMNCDPPPPPTHWQWLLHWFMPRAHGELYSQQQVALKTYSYNLDFSLARGMYVIFIKVDQFTNTLYLNNFQYFHILMPSLLKYSNWINFKCI